MKPRLRLVEIIIDKNAMIELIWPRQAGCPRPRRSARPSRPISHRYLIDALRGSIEAGAGKRPNRRGRVARRPSPHGQRSLRARRVGPERAAATGASNSMQRPATRSVASRITASRTRCSAHTCIARTFARLLAKQLRVELPKVCCQGIGSRR
jgi:hypothetical protein